MSFTLTSSLKYKIVGILLILVGVILFGQAFMVFLTQMLSFSTLGTDPTTGRIIIPTSPVALICAEVAVPAILGVIFSLLGFILYCIPMITDLSTYLKDFSTILNPKEPETECQCRHNCQNYVPRR
jgi:hypothetical protein